MRRGFIACFMSAFIFCWTTSTYGGVIYKDVAELAAQAEQIVIGDVIEVTCFWDNNYDLIKSHIVVDVADYLVGEGTGIEEFTMSGGTIDGLTLRVSVLPVFEVGDHVLFYLGDNEIRLVESYQGAYLTDGELIARMAPACGRILADTIQPLSKHLEQIRQALPPAGPPLAITPYKGGFRLPLDGDRYGLCGFDWTYQANPMGENYKINANCVDSSAGDASSQRTQIQNGANAWNNAGADFEFTYGGTSTQTAVSYNNTNLIHFDTTPPDGGSYVAANYIWYDGGDILENDIIFNDRDYTWWNGSGGCSNMMDICNIATHELGHSLCLDDLYGGGDSEKTMYGYVGYCETKKRTLHSDDINGIIAIYGGGGGGYCSASSNSTSYEHISNVNVGSINNSSGSSGYADYTAQSTDMARGTGYTITVTIGSPYSSDIGGCWVDWNQDEDFGDTNETITTSWSGSGPYNTTITPPAGAALGSTRMRVRIQDGDYDPTLSPCGSIDYGEVEDYTINVTDAGDSTPPNPNPMTFNTAPYPIASNQISMVATTATDSESPPVQYYFDFYTGGSGGTDSGWQSLTSYTDSSLAANTNYTYRVKARDSATTPNETTYSSNSTTATYIQTPTGISFGSVTATSIELNATGALSNLNADSSGAYFDSTTSGGDGGINNWIQTTTDDAIGLSPDTLYTFRVKARNRNAIETSYSSSNSKATLANTPAAPTLSSPTSSTLNVNVNPNGNPSSTEYAIRCTATNPSDPTWNSQYIDAAGQPSASAVWRTDSQWGTITATGLEASTDYTFAVKARNQESVETVFGPGATQSTSSGGYSIGDLNCDGSINSLDIDPFVLATTSAPSFDDYYAEYPDCDAMLADCNEDGSVNSLDVDPFVDLLS